MQLSDHNVMWMLISAYVVQFEKGDAIPIPVITRIPGYCTVHVYRSNIKLYSGLIKAHQGYNCGCTLARAAMHRCYRFLLKCKHCITLLHGNGNDTQRKHLIWLHALHKIVYKQMQILIFY